MLNKKGDIGYIIYLVPGLILLTIVIIVFSIIFFVVGFANSHTPQVTPGASYVSNIKLFNLLRSDISYKEKNINVADYIMIVDINPVEKDDFLKNFSPLLEKLPKPNLYSSSWIFEVRKNNIIMISAGDNSVSESKYLEQEINIPSESGDILNVRLFLKCYCTNEELEGIA